MASINSLSIFSAGWLAARMCFQHGKRVWWVAVLVLLPNAAAQADSTRALFAATLTGLDGQPIALAQYQGKPLIVNFWARWCQPCRTEIPELVKLHRDYQSRGLEVLGIALEGKVEPVRDFAKSYRMDYPVVLAQTNGQALMRSLGNPRMGLPFTVAIDRTGKLVTIRLGALHGKELVAIAEAAINDRPSQPHRTAR